MLAKVGSIIDASFVAAHKQCNSREDKTQIIDRKGLEGFDPYTAEIEWEDMGPRQRTGILLILEPIIQNDNRHRPGDKQPRVCISDKDGTIILEKTISDKTQTDF